MSDQPADDEVLKIMIDGGERLCEYAITQWTGYKYASNPKQPTDEDNAMRRENILRWNIIKNRIRPLARELKGQQK